jgi:aspartyl-tRNA(Asn)/glutamyl-tRNA(Gln) amidotransferase subunit A
MIPAALGSQTGGSTLRPAAYNGIVGLKPTSGRISNHGVIPVAWTYDHVGILARSVADAGLLLSALTGYDPLDPLSVPGYADDLGRSLSTSPPAIGVLRFPFADRCDSETRQALVRTIETLERSGAEIREVELPGVFEAVEETAPIITATEVAAYHREQFTRLGDRYGPKISATISQGLETSGPDYAQARRRRDQIVREVESRLAGAADVFVLPAVPTVAPLDRSTTGEQYFLRTWTFTGLPSIVVPIGLSADGLPFSMQMVGHRWADASLLHAAAWVESVVGFDSGPPCWGRTSS